MQTKTKTAWQEALSDLITDPKELWQLLALDQTLLPAATEACRIFPLKVPRQFVARMQKGNVRDPLLLQVLPLGAELAEDVGYARDPLQETAANPIPGLLHKYQGRVLVTLTSACAVHCRYCFRKFFPYEENNPGKAGLEKILNFITDDNTLSEVILSGGDPLVVNDKTLVWFAEQLQLIPHIKRLRIHTRVPIVIPSRITTDFMHWLSQIKLQTVLVLHINHAQEIDDEVAERLLALKRIGICLLNQSVLLKNINDTPEILMALSEKLFSVGVLPYYLHLLDKVQGTAHFDVSREQAKILQQQLTQKLPGYLVPKLVYEEPGKPAKTLLSTDLYTH